MPIESRQKPEHKLAQLASLLEKLPYIFVSFLHTLTAHLMGRIHDNFFSLVGLLVNIH